MDDVVGWVRSTDGLLRERREHQLRGLEVLGGGCVQGAQYITVGQGGRRGGGPVKICVYLGLLVVVGASAPRRRS